jgi:hypothetical protein
MNVDRVRASYIYYVVQHIYYIKLLSQIVVTSPGLDVPH